MSPSKKPAERPAFLCYYCFLIKKSVQSMDKILKENKIEDKVLFKLIDTSYILTFD